MKRSFTRRLRPMTAAHPDLRATGASTGEPPHRTRVLLTGGGVELAPDPPVRRPAHHDRARDRTPCRGRLAGACAAALFDVGIDLAEVAEHFGQDVADALEDDLRHLVPDLVRWHLPGTSTAGPPWATTAPSSSPATGRRREGTPPRHAVPVRHHTRDAAGTAAGHPELRHAPRRGPVGVFGSTTEDWRYARHLWDARHTADLREHAMAPDGCPSSTRRADCSARTRCPPPIPAGTRPPGPSGRRCCTRKGRSRRPSPRPASTPTCRLRRAAPAGTGAIRRGSSAGSRSTTPGSSGRSAASRARASATAS
ncbi:hypothetical protein ACFQV4_15185 [Streptomyces thermocarboxydus]